MPNLKPGNLTEGDPTDFEQFSGSMAQAMEQALDELLATDGLPPLLMDDNNREVRDRRRFLIAIARGVVQHLVDNPDAFVVEVVDGEHQLRILADQLP